MGDDDCEPGCAIDQHMHPSRHAGPRAVVPLEAAPEDQDDLTDAMAPPRAVLVRVEAYDDGTGILEVGPNVSDREVSDYLLHLAGVAERGEHHQEHVEAPNGS